METYWVIAELQPGGWRYLKTNITGNKWSKNPYDAKFYKNPKQIVKSVDRFNKSDCYGRRRKAVICQVQFEFCGTMEEIAEKELLGENEQD